MVISQERTDFKPALLAAVLLHVFVLAAGLFVWPWFGKIAPAGVVTPVTLVSAPPAPLKRAIQAPEPAPAQAPEPVPVPTPPPPPPAPAPEPKPQPQPQPAPPKPAPPPPKPAPKPTPVPTPPKPTPQPAKPQTAKASQNTGLDLAALTSSLDKTSKSDPRKAQGAKGALRPETATVAREDNGAAEAATANAADAVGARLNRIWNKSCGVEGFRDIVVQVRFNLTPDGDLSGQPQVINAPAGASAVWQAASDRAVRAVAQAAPFRELPKQTYSQWRTFNAVFDAKEACKNQ